MEKYLFHVPKEDHPVDLLHATQNLHALLMEAKFLNRTPIVPNVYLNGKHNNGKAVITDWSTYIDLNAFQEFVPFTRLSDFGDINAENGLLVHEDTDPVDLMDKDERLIVRKHLQYPNYYRLIPKVDRETWERQLRDLTRPSQNILKYAGLALAKMGRFHCIHVRRGDKLGWKQCPGLDAGTRPKALLKFLKKRISRGETLYIMSNEPDEHFFDSLKDFYQVVTFRDFPEYMKLQETDNYLLFSVENEIMKQAQTKIKTFQEPGHISLMNYPPNGRDSITSKIRRRWKYLLMKLSLQSSAL